MQILNGMRKQVAGFSLAFMIASMFAVSVAQAATFTDVQPSAWYYPYVEDLAAQSILDTSKGTYRPGDLVNRAEMAKLAVVAFDLPMETAISAPFKDVPLGQWFTDYVATAVKNGVVGGYKDGSGSLTGYFGPNDPVTREQAMKMLVLAAPLPSNTTGGPHFPDVPVSTWSYEFVETGYYWSVVDGYPDGTFGPGNNINRAEIAKVVSNAMNPVERTTTPPVAAPGDLTVAVDSTSPNGMDIPKNGSNILFTVFSFKASSNEDVRIEQVIITREGLGLPGDFTNVKLYVNGVQKGGEKTVNSTSNTATFNMTSDPIVATAGSYTLVEVRGDLAGAENSQNRLCINTGTDVTAFGQTTGAALTVGGTFGLCGENMTTTSASVGTLTYKVTQPSTADINVGDTDIVMTKLRLDATVEDMIVDRITFKQMGSADGTDFANARLVVSGVPLDVVGTWNGKYLTFDLTELATKLLITKGSSKNLELWVNVVGGLNNTAAFDIYRDWNIEGTGQVYHYGVNVDEDGASITPTNRDIVGGNIAFSLSANNPITGEVAKGKNDHKFTSFNISTAGDAVTVRKLTLTVSCTAGGTAAEIEDVKIWSKNSAGTLAVVAGPNDVLACGDIAYTDSFDVPGAKTTEYIITGDIINAAVAGHKFDIDVADVTSSAKTELEFTAGGDPVDEATEVSGGVLDGNLQTVATPSVAVSLAATPGDKTYVKNTTARDLAAFDFAASTADDIKATAVTVTCTIGSGADCSDAFQSLNLFLKEGSTLTLLDGPRSLSAAGTGGTAVFSFTQAIPAGNSARLLVRGNIASAAGAGTYLFNIAAAGVTAEDSEGSDATVTGLATASRTITVAASGSATTQNVTGVTTKGRILVGDSLMQPVLTIRFSASDLEDWYVRKLQIEDYGCFGPETTSKVYLTYNDGTGPYTASANLLGVCPEADFNLPVGHYIHIPANGTTNVTVSVDVGTVIVGGIAAGELPQYAFDSADNFEAVGASSATLDTDASAGAPVTGGDAVGEVMRDARTAPSVALGTGLGTTLVNGSNQSLYKWTVKADAAHDLSVKQFGLSMTASDADGGGELDMSDFKLYRNGSLVSDQSSIDIIEDFSYCAADVEPGGTTLNAFADGPDFQIYVQWRDGGDVGEEVIAAGTTNTYELKATVAGAESSDSLSTELMNDTSGDAGTIAADANCDTISVDGSGLDTGLVWSDLSISPHDSDLTSISSDWLDGYLVDGLSSIGSVSLSKT